MAGDLETDVSGRTAAASESRALVIAPAAFGPALTDRPAPTFLAQLLACERRLPIYRAKRRSEPGPAATAYERSESPTATMQHVDMSI